MADHEAKDYQATGPTDIAFRTHGTRIENGVATGTHVGVHGIGFEEGTTRPSIGVKGEGVTGVSGVGGIGVDGFSKHSTGVKGHSELGVGVRGESDVHHGIVGTSNGIGTSGVFGEQTEAGIGLNLGNRE
jgi:hypothetical protein